MEKRFTEKKNCAKKENGKEEKERENGKKYDPYVVRIHEGANGKETWFLF